MMANLHGGDGVPVKLNTEGTVTSMREEQQLTQDVALVMVWPEAPHARLAMCA
jgi:cell envelope opacity-associated protein A